MNSSFIYQRVSAISMEVIQVQVDSCPVNEFGFFAKNLYYNDAIIQHMKYWPMIIDSLFQEDHDSKI